jgi:hypothetical protein
MFHFNEPLTLQDRLRHGILPTAPERNAIVDSITAAEQRMYDIRAAGSAIQGSPASPDDEETALCQYISDYSSMLAPIRALPQDVLEHIFLDPAICDTVLIGRAGMSSAVNGHNPHILASVCHYWRCVALETPRLWSTFEVNGCGGYYSLCPKLAVLSQNIQTYATKHHPGYFI